MSLLLCKTKSYLAYANYKGTTHPGSKGNDSDLISSWSGQGGVGMNEQYGAKDDKPFLYLLGSPDPSRPMMTECHRLRRVTSHSLSFGFPEPDSWWTPCLWARPLRMLEEGKAAFYLTFTQIQSGLPPSYTEGETCFFACCWLIRKLVAVWRLFSVPLITFVHFNIIPIYSPWKQQIYSTTKIKKRKCKCYFFSQNDGCLVASIVGNHMGIFYSFKLGSTFMYHKYVSQITLHQFDKT